jgi:hypothetical protein
MSIQEVEANAALGVSIVVTERIGNLYGTGVELFGQDRPVKHLSLCSEALSKEAAIYKAIPAIAQHIPEDIKLLLVRCEQSVHLSRHVIQRNLQGVENAPQIHVSNAQLHDYRYRTLLDLAESSIHGRSTVQTLSKI